ncbi:MAG: peptidyl-prolyl cis-trans isomerase [Thiothrix sp.]|nr:peptidyl-prolyl cis-trans isomerase [Thiothrix sp.]
MKRKLFILFLFVLALAGCGSSATTTSESAQPTTGGNSTMSDHPQVLLETSKGNITLELDTKAAPDTVQNFLGYVQDGFYNGTIFHRVIPGFMVQGGGMNTDMSDKTTRAPIRNEAGNGLKNNRGTVAMARTNAPHSASSQFFINVADNDFLNFRNETPQGWGYAVFGKVVEGMDVVDAIVGVKTGNHGMHQNVPEAPITIDKASVVQ